MRLRVAALASLCALLGCHRRAPRARRVSFSASSTHAQVQVAAAEGEAFSLDAQRFVIGALRVESGARAAPPFPATAIAIVERRADGWRFVARDRTAYAAATFIGPLAVTGVDHVDLPAPHHVLYRDLTDGGARVELRTAEAELLRLLPPHERTPLPLPAEPWEAAARTDGHIDVLRGDELLRLHRDTLALLARSAAPGTACTLHRAWLGTRAVCTHAGWARAVFAEERDWSTLRDELHGEPMGDLAFDPRTPLWAVGAPCAQAPAPQGNRACVYRPDGGRVELTLPFDGSPVAAFDGGVLFVESLRESATSAAAIWRDGRLSPLTLPARPAAARAARWEDGAVSIVDGATLVRVWLRGDAVRSSLRLPAPTGASALVLGERAVFALGRDRAWRMINERFVPQPLAFEGGRAGRDLAAGEGYCAGPWCRLSDAMWWSAAGIRPASALAHRDAVASAAER